MHKEHCSPAKTQPATHTVANPFTSCNTRVRQRGTTQQLAVESRPSQGTQSMCLPQPAALWGVHSPLALLCRLSLPGQRALHCLGEGHRGAPLEGTTTHSTSKSVQRQHNHACGPSLALLALPKCPPKPAAAMLSEKCCRSAALQPQGLTHHTRNMCTECPTHSMQREAGSAAAASSAVRSGVLGRQRQMSHAGHPCLPPC